jgi:hypothetical protein
MTTEKLDMLDLASLEAENALQQLATWVDFGFSASLSFPIQSQVSYFILRDLYTSDQGLWPREILHYDWRIRAGRSKDTLYQP